MSEQKLLAWSHSRRGDYIRCPLMFAHKVVWKTVQYEQSAQAHRGDQIHKALEKHIRSNVPLPAELEPVYGKYARSIRNAPGHKFVEFEYALTKDFTPTGYKDWDGAWVRAKADVRLLSADQTKVAIVDWKTGKPNIDRDQLKLTAAIEFDTYPQVDKVTAVYVWTAYGKEDKEEYYRQERDALWEDLLPEVHEMQESYVMDSWRPKAGNHCGWCPVNKAKLCPHTKVPYKDR